jgi:hypothetical protein
MVAAAVGMTLKDHKTNTQQIAIISDCISLPNKTYMVNPKIWIHDFTV